MVDTVKIWTKITLDNTLLNRDNKWEKWIWKGKDLVVYSCDFKKVRFSYIPAWNMLYAEFSIPKFLYGSNAFMFFEKDTPILKNMFSRITWQLLNRTTPSILEWEVSRIDFCYNFLVGCNEDKKRYIELSMLTHNGYFKAKHYNTTAFFYNKSHSYKLYDKAAEMQFSGNVVEPWMERILRLETTIRRRKVLQLFGGKQKCVKLRHVLRDHVAKDNLNRCIKYLGLDTKPLDENEITGKILASGVRPSTKHKLIEFINTVNTIGIAEAKRIYKKKFDYYKKKLSELGISSFFIGTDIHFLISFIVILPSKDMVTFDISIIVEVSTIFIPNAFHFEDGGG